MIINSVSLNNGTNNSLRRNNYQTFQANKNIIDSDKIVENILRKESSDLPVKEFINEYYKNENNLFINKKIGVNIKRLSEMDQYEIYKNADKIMLSPRTFLKIILTKKENNSFRFSPEEALNLFIDSADKIKKYPNVFNKIVQTKTKEGKERFNSSECSYLMQNAEVFDKYPKTFDKVLKKEELELEEIKDIILKIGKTAELLPIEILEKALLNINSNISSKDNARNIITSFKSLAKSYIRNLKTRLYNKK